MFNLKHFYYFFMVAETGSVTAAANLLKISQPALSKQIKVFEYSLDTKLFERKGRNLKLTAAGLSLFGQARNIFERAEHLSRNFSTQAGIERQQVRLGLGSSIDRSIASDVIAEFFSLQVDSHTQPSLSVSSFDSDAIRRYLQEKVIDACITDRTFSDQNLIAAASIASPICLVVPKSNAIKGKRLKQTNLKALLGALKLPWLAPTSNLRLRHELNEIAEQNNFELMPILESDSISTIVRSVENGVGMALIPRHYIRAAHDPSRIVVFDQLKSIPMARLYLWIRRDQKDRTWSRQLSQAFDYACSYAERQN